MFQFWEEVYYANVKPKFPSTSTEAKAIFVGVTDTVAFKILISQHTHKIRYRSNVLTAEDK